MGRKRKRLRGSPVAARPAVAPAVRRTAPPMPWAVFWLAVMMLAGMPHNVRITTIA
ncbi:hypothetical protein ACWGID_07260 [Kribbella sp. NPDC054772]